MRLTGLDADKNYFEKTIPHHECTEEDYAEFYPIVKNLEKNLEVTKTLFGGFECIDWDNEDEPILIYGDRYHSDVFQNLNVILVPCNYIGAFGESTVTPECIPDLE